MSICVFFVLFVCLYVLFLCIQPSPKQGTIPYLIIHCTHFLNYDALESERKRGGRWDRRAGREREKERELSFFSFSQSFSVCACVRVRAARARACFCMCLCLCARVIVRAYMEYQSSESVNVMQICDDSAFSVKAMNTFTSHRVTPVSHGAEVRGPLVRVTCMRLPDSSTPTSVGRNNFKT